MGGDRQMYFRAGQEVPAVSSEDNVGGWYSLSAHDLDAILNP